MGEITYKQVQYLVYKLQDYAMVPEDTTVEMYWTYDNMTSQENVKRVSSIWEEVFGKRIEDMEAEKLKPILDIFSPGLGNKDKRERLRKKLSKFIKGDKYE